MYGRTGLPEDMVFEILSWLPAGSLIRFKRLKKSVRDLIENPNFATKHLRRQNRFFSGDSLLLIRRFSPNPEVHEHRFSLFNFADDNKNTSSVVNCVDFPFFSVYKSPFIMDESLVLVSCPRATCDAPFSFENQLVNGTGGDDKSGIELAKLETIGPLHGVKRCMLVFWKDTQVLFESWNHIRIVSYKKGCPELRLLPIFLTHNHRWKFIPAVSYQSRQDMFRK